MKICRDVPAILSYILDNHKFLDKNGYGAHAYKFIRQSDGIRIPFEITKGFRIFDFAFHSDTLVIDQLLAKHTFGGKVKQILSSKLYLQNLIAINVYDDKADFISLSSIDFTYIANHKDAEIKMLCEWINNDPGIRRASWTNSTIDKKILDSILKPKPVRIKRQRMIDLEFDDL